ncbi:MAG: hypothetical protein ALECFALPRED_010046 [Alectoria fallacina]|uniref:Uncharacterized protein n=1 Tax=Alectoria fallacina TaxID=1903189 RepID=A0A8H3F3A1_9LECA|nr:MAG: hypothetical protein ALECFALPRED_010046 [Alectoria fallacina]
MEVGSTDFRKTSRGDQRGELLAAHALPLFSCNRRLEFVGSRQVELSSAPLLDNAGRPTGFGMLKLVEG